MLSNGTAQDVKIAFSTGEYRSKTCFRKRFCFFSAIKRSPELKNERVFAYLFRTCKIVMLKNQRVKHYDFAGCKTFCLCSTTPPCAELAIAFLAFSGICWRL